MKKLLKWIPWRWILLRWVPWQFLSWNRHRDPKGWKIKRDWNQLVRDALVFQDDVDGGLPPAQVTERAARLSQLVDELEEQKKRHFSTVTLIAAGKFGIPLPQRSEGQYWLEEDYEGQPMPDLSEAGIAYLRQQIRDERQARLWWLREITPVFATAFTALLGLGGVAVAIITVWRTT